MESSEVYAQLEFNSELTLTPTATMSPFPLGPHPQPSEHWLWVSFGPSYSNLNQQSELTKFEGSGYDGLAIAMGGGGWISEQVGLDLACRAGFGKVLGSQSISVEQSRHTWQSTSVHGVLRKVPTTKPRSEWNLRLGIQNHLIPIFVPQTSSSITTYENAVLTASAGFAYRRTLSENFNFEWQMHYQYPMSSSAQIDHSYSIRGNLVFDGSIGTNYKLNDILNLGLFWHSQYHDYDFTFADETNGNFSGNQSILHSTMDLRLGMEF